MALRVRLLLIVLMVLVIPTGLMAQARLTAADLEGTVQDQTGAVLPGVTVTATNQATNQSRTAVTDKDGRYYIGALQPGLYTIGAELAGFAPQQRKDTRLVIGQLADIHLTMRAGTAEAIVVSAKAPVVDTTETSVSTVVGQEQIDNLPTNGRNFLSFSVITPGVTNDRTPQQGASATSGLTFGGQRARSNNIMVDGVDNNDPIVGAVRATFSQEAIQEFQVLTNSYSAEFGKASGGVVNIITRSGTNEMRGNVFEFFRNKSLNSEGHFEQFDVFGNHIDQEKAPFRQNQFGFTLGGPVRRDQTFYFLSAEALNTNTSNFVNIDPTAAGLLRQAGFPIELGNVPYEVRSRQYLGKVDHQWSAGHNLTMRGNYASLINENIEPFGGITARSRGAVQDRTDWALAASNTDTLSQRWINEVRAQYAKEDQMIESLDPNCGGKCDTNDKGGPTVEIIGVASVGRQRFTPQPRKNDRYQLKDTLSFYNGTHSAKVGFDYNYIHTGFTALPLHFGGRYIFAALPAIPALGINQPISATQAFAAGLPAAYVQGYGTSGDSYNDPDIALFAQDDWSLSEKLTLKMGVRYQRQWMYDIPYTVSMPAGGSYTYKIPQDTNNFGPRLSLSYDPMGDGRSSMHAAWGIFYDNQIIAAAQIGNGVDGRNLRTLVVRIPTSIGAWRAPGHKLPEPTTPYPSLVISPDPGMETPFSQQAAVGYDHAIGQTVSVSADFLYVHGEKQLGTIDYNPIIPALGAGRRPNDINGTAGTSASILQYTSFGQTWYKGLTLSLNKRLSNRLQFLLSYTLSKAEDNSTDFQSAFIPQSNGQGRNPNDLTGLPIGFDPKAERGRATQDQKHRFVLSGFYQFPWEVQFSTIVTAASGRPYTPLAGVDLNGDGDGGAFPSDRARTNPADPSTSVKRNSETMRSQLNLDTRLSKTFSIGGNRGIQAMIDVFNLLNRANYTEINNIFGTGAFPGSPQKDAQGRVTYGRYTEALPGRQIQLAAKLIF
ncbi:MAG TPA: carboxypeptidase regulatory-like domain-containing protein [Thermoanaerobaculia bacterium]|nr:carboxypeptidase regulatory-like domain-containing protein [Thermoanaerobaculia bacterium]